MANGNFIIGLLLEVAVGTARAQDRAKHRWIAIKRLLGCGMALAGFAMTQPAHAALTLTVTDPNAGGVISACSTTDAGTGTFSKTCSNQNFAQIIVNAVGFPLVPSPNLVATQLSATSGALATSDTLMIDVAQTGVSFPGGEASVSLTLGGLFGGAGPVTLMALGPGGVTLFSKTFTTTGGATSAAIPVGPVTGDVARFILTFSGPNQTVNAIISITGTATPDVSSLTDSKEPGSVIVFPKFIGGRSAAGGPVNVDGVTLPRTEIELGIVCPPGVTPTLTVCFEHQSFKVRGDWVCPGSQAFDSKGICEDTSFEVFISIDGKSAFPADGGTYFSNQPHVQAPQCKNGYLIMWVVDNANRPIKFDGLIGDAVLRGPNNAAPSTSVAAGFSTAVSSYSAIPIQASVLNATNDVLDAEPTSLFPGGTELIFDGALNITKWQPG